MKLQYTIITPKTELEIKNKEILFTGYMDSVSLKKMIGNHLEEKNNNFLIHVVQDIDYFLNHVFIDLPNDLKEKMKDFHYDMMISLTYNGMATIKVLTPIGVLKTENFVWDMQ